MILNGLLIWFLASIWLALRIAAVAGTPHAGTLARYAIQRKHSRVSPGAR